MNGARSTFMRKGYWLTALATAVLLAASSGTAQAQQLEDVTVTLSAPRSVGEGADAQITVRGEAMVLPTPEAGDSSTARTVTVDLVLAGGAASGSATVGEFAQQGQVNDAGIISNPRVTLTFAENTGTGNRTRTATGTITVRTNEDSDAEDERVLVTGDVTSPVGSPDDATASFTISDNETQTYVLTLNTTVHGSTNPPKEAETIEVRIEAKPAHYQAGETFTLQIDGPRGYAANGDGSDADASTAAIGTDSPTAGGTALTTAVNRRAITIMQSHSSTNGDGNRVTDMITLEAYAGRPGRDTLEASMDIDVLDIHMLPAASAITAVAKDKDGNDVTKVMEGGDPVFLTITVDRGKGAGDRITEEELTVDIEASDASQVADYELSESRVMLESRSSGKQSTDVDLDIELSARSDEDVGMEYLMLNLELSGDSDIGSETSTGTFAINLVDGTMKKVEPKAEADAYPKIQAALGQDPETSVMNPGETGTIMTSDLFTVMDGYTASYGVSVEGGAVSVSASSDSITVTAGAVGESKVTVTARAKMAASSFLPEQTVSDVAHITFPVMVTEAAMPEPVPALPLIAQWLLGLGLLGGGARQLFRRRRQGS